MNSKLVFVLFGLFVSSAAFLFPTIEQSEQGSTSIISDMRHNISEFEYNLITQSIKEAEDNYKPTDYQNLARYVSINSKNTTEQIRWNVYVFEGRIRQVGVNPQSGAWGKYMWLLNYGKYNLTYILIGTNGLFCWDSREYGGDSSTPEHFGKDINATGQQVITAALDNALIYGGNDIMNNVAKAYQLINQGINGHWTVIIADPSARYGYWNCMMTANSWFAFQAYKEFKWNYFGSVRYN